MARLCPGEPEERSRKVTLTEKDVQKEHASLQSNVFLGRKNTENVYNFDYDSNRMTLSCDSMDDIEKRVAIAQKKFNAFSNI